jgi:hypothetical protein
MYSGTTLTPVSGRILGAHQKFDRVARRHLKLLLAEYDNIFPEIKEILRFEGRNGPDGIKRKSPAQNEPWHYINPFDEADSELHVIIKDHYNALVSALMAQNNTKAAFEAAWLAHAIVDGLTPAHHYPYESELQKLRGDQGRETRDTIMRKVIMPGSKPSEQMRNNWKMWGPKGLLSTHGMFEFGVATIVAPLKLRRAFPDKTALEALRKKDIVKIFHETSKEIAAMDLYVKYYKTGWTPKLARKVRRNLAPLIVQVITLAWYSAVLDAQQKAGK